VTAPGINQPTYLNGYVFNFPPKTITPTPVFGESVRRARDGALLDHTHRSAITEPDVSSKFRIEVEWDQFTEADVFMWLRCVARRGPFTFCPWMLWHEEFTFLTGETLAGTLQRGSAKNEIPSALAVGTPSTDFDATFYVDDVLSAAFTVGAMTNYRTPFTSALTGPAVVSVVYAPLFLVRVVDQTPILLQAAQSGKFVVEEY